MSLFAKTCVCGRRALPGSGRCELHQIPVISEAERLARQPYRSAYHDPVYLHNRELAFRRAGGRCEACRSPLGRDWVCDHVVPLRDGGSSVLGNLQALCGPCSKTKTRADRKRRKGKVN